MDLLPALRDPRHLQPLRGRLDGRDPRVRRPGREAHRRNLRQTGHHPRAAVRPCRPRLLDDVQAGRAAARRSRRHPVPFAAPREQRQSLFGSAVQDPEIPARVPRPVRLDRGRPGALPGLLPLVQQPAPPRRARPAHRRRCPPRPRGCRPGRPRRRPGHRLPATIPSASSASHPPRRNYRGPPGSTRPKRKKPTSSNKHPTVPHSG